MKIYTSYYSKMSERLKTDLDFYIQVSRTIFCPKRAKSGKPIDREIDFNYGELFGYYSDSLKDYYKDLDSSYDDIEKFVKNLNNFAKEEKEKHSIGEMKKGEEVQIFLLCHESLTRPCARSERCVKEGLYREGDYKECHRRVLSRYLMDKFNLDIPEYDIPEDLKKTVYRLY